MLLLIHLVPLLPHQRPNVLLQHLLHLFLPVFGLVLALHIQVKGTPWRHGLGWVPRRPLLLLFFGRRRHRGHFLLSLSLPFPSLPTISFGGALGRGGLALLTLPRLLHPARLDKDFHLLRVPGLVCLGASGPRLEGRGNTNEVHAK